MNDYPVDIVILWVDGNDPIWRAEYEKWAIEESGDKREIRFRDWDNLQYIFRGIELYMPWIRKVFFVTYGHLPQWLNTENEKLVIVNHESFMPRKYLPSFSALSIEMNLHRIKDLSERFIYFNDDFFVLKPLKKSNFFKKGLPIHVASLEAYCYKKEWNSFFAASDIAIINEHFNKFEVIKKHWAKWFSFRNGIWLYKTLTLFPYRFFTGMKHSHMPEPLCKSTFRTVWEIEKEALDETCSHRFRKNTDLNQWLIIYWDLASGEFFPGDRGGKMCLIGSTTDVNNCVKAIESRHHAFIAINDYCPNDDFFVSSKNSINDALQRVLPRKSSFEK